MEPFKFDNTETLTLESKEGVLYDIFIKYPNSDEQTPPKKGYPVIYMLDGNATFPVAVAYSNLSSVAPKKGIRPIPQIIVGITYHDSHPFSKQRIFDFTPKAIPEKMEEKYRNMNLNVDDTGGIEAFIDFIEMIVKPYVETKYFINKENQKIVGHSLGGLFATYVLLKKRYLYQHYLIGSPSLWWNGGELLTDCITFKPGKETIKVLVGDLEPSFMQTRAEKLVTDLTEKVARVNYSLCENKNHLDVLFETVFQAFKI